MSKIKRDYILFLEDILNSIEKLEKYTKDLDFKAFSENDMVIDAVTRNLEVMGEAITNVPPDVQKKYPEVEWKEAKGFRNILIHDYFGIDLESIWDTINDDIPLLKKHIAECIERRK